MEWIVRIAVLTFFAIIAITLLAPHLEVIGRVFKGIDISGIMRRGQPLVAPPADGKKRMRPGLITLAFIGYIIYFWFQYAFLRYWVVEWTGLSPFLVILLLTVQQIIIIGILYYLVEPLMPEASKVRYAFIMISVFGALNLYMGYAVYPYEFFDFKTGESRFWVSDEEDKIYYASGYSKLYGTPLRQGTKKDAIKYKSQIDNSLFVSPLKKIAGHETLNDDVEGRQASLNDWYQSEQKAIAEMLKLGFIDSQEADRRMSLLIAQHESELKKIASTSSDSAPMENKLKKSIRNFPVALKITFIVAAAFLFLGLIWNVLKNGWLKIAALLAIGGTAIYFIIAILQSSGIAI